MSKKLKKNQNLKFFNSTLTTSNTMSKDSFLSQIWKFNLFKPIKNFLSRSDYGKCQDLCLIQTQHYMLTIFNDLVMTHGNLTTSTNLALRRKKMVIITETYFEPGYCFIESIAPMSKSKACT